MKLKPYLYCVLLFKHDDKGTDTQTLYGMCFAVDDAHATGIALEGYDTSYAIGNIKVGELSESIITEIHKYYESTRE